MKTTQVSIGIIFIVFYIYYTTNYNILCFFTEPEPSNDEQEFIKNLPKDNLSLGNSIDSDLKEKRRTSINLEYKRVQRDDDEIDAPK